MVDDIYYSNSNFDFHDEGVQWDLHGNSPVWKLLVISVYLCKLL